MRRGQQVGKDPIKNKSARRGEDTKEHGDGNIVQVEPTSPKEQAKEGSAIIHVKFSKKDQHGNNVFKNVRLKAKVLTPEMRGKTNK